MKKLIERSILCPECGTEGKVRWVEKFNDREDKILLSHLIEETHEKYICEKCKHERRYYFQFMYCGTTQEVNVDYIPEDEMGNLWSISD